ncbi:hypothetical protein JKP88DRAFT_267404 [Tribonema minus]|uniref:Uncharacterized protein n=1 Tax=Tribonema minus TaxID=303371 RepID=A0A835ZHF6_9STRA|nr:hypothetical protein JKP88DRAFT_267404 [Tribonema minus]
MARVNEHVDRKLDGKSHWWCKLRVDHDSAWRYPRVAAYKTVATLHVIASEVDTAAAPASMLPQRADVEELVAEADTLDHLQWVLDSVKVRRYFAMGYYDGMLSPGSSSEGATLHITGSSTPRFTFPKGLDKVVLRRVSGSYTLPPVASISMLECWCANNPLQLPPQIECLALRAPWFSLPITIPETSTLRSLTLRSWTSKLPEEKPPAVLPRLPSILHELIIDNYDTMYGRVVIHLDTPLGHLPLGLRKLVLKAHMFNQPLGPLPPALEDLDLSGSPGFDQQLGALPDKLQILRLHPHYTQKLGELPASLKTLQIGAQYPHPLHMYVGTDIVRIAKPR